MRFIALLAAVLMSACSGGARKVASTGPVPSGTSAKLVALEEVPGSPVAGASAQPAREVNPEVLERFNSYLAKYEDATYERLKAELPLPPRREMTLPFDPTHARYFDRVAKELRLTSAERERLRKQGVVSVDHLQAYSMSSAYFAIYARDLPVLVTTDSILHALHRSYDDVLKDLEVGLFTDTIDTVLAALHDEIEKRNTEAATPELKTSLGDVDLYVSVARNLLAGSGVPKDQGNTTPALVEPSQVSLVVSSKTGRDAEVRSLLEKISSLKMEIYEVKTDIYGGKRWIDYSQFRARGHYTESIPLKRYFRTMMWLGRADTGWILRPPDPISGLQIDDIRERRDAALFAYLLSAAKVDRRLRGVSDIIGFMVGQSDNLGPYELGAALKGSGIDTTAEFADDKRLAAVFDSTTSGAQQIRSQVLESDKNSPKKTAIPTLFQVFGQRFLLDSFVLSQVVFDSILFEKKKQPRMMPSGLDVMAALGNDEAVRLLEPELEHYNYSANLLASRRVVEDHTADAWRSNLYYVWVDALRKLDDVPDQSVQFPNVMRSLPWARKQLQTQLASWAELRHDTLLYGKQSYTGVPLCGYPDGFVEPYPDFYATLKFFGQEAARRLSVADVSHPDANRARLLAGTRDRQVSFFRHFESVMGWLEKIARKELAAKPFSAEEGAFLKKTIDIRGGGSGPPRYDGWYPTLIYRDPARYKPTVADVHTDPAEAKVLEVATGSANFLVVAVDNQHDYAVYVGPTYSYYEFTAPVQQRLTDEEWSTRLQTTVPNRPEWVSAFAAPPLKRDLGPAPRRPEPTAVSPQLDCGCPPGDKTCPCP